MEADRNPHLPSAVTPARRYWVKYTLQIFLLIAGVDAVLFGIAGRIDWVGAWVFTSIYLAFLVIVVVWAMRNARGLLEERSRIAPNVKTWDKVIGVIYGVLLLFLLVVAALDGGRFRWSTMPMLLQWVGAVGLLPAGGVIWWAMSVNPFLSKWARIQDDRGHQVVQGGPYQYIRHPMYAAVIFFMIFLSLLLGSWWALIPAGLIGGLYVVRTALEDSMLQGELPGYREYSTRVRYRLFPGLW